MLQGMTKERPRINLAIDLVLLRFTPEGKGDLQVLLLKRSKDPEIGKWSLPGGFVYSGEDRGMETAIGRILDEKIKVSLGKQEWDKQQLGCFYTKERDERNVATVVYWGLISNAIDVAKEVSNNDDLEIFSVNKSGTSDNWEVFIERDGIKEKLAFDHNAILKEAIIHLSETMERKSTATKFFGEKFTTNDLRFAYETVWSYSDSTFGSKSRFTQLVKKNSENEENSFSISENTEIDDEFHQDAQPGRPSINWKKDLNQPVKNLQYPFPRKKRRPESY